jgi:steroid 5-alpha reductase family enzyme
MPSLRVTRPWMVLANMFEVGAKLHIAVQFLILSLPFAMFFLCLPALPQLNLFFQRNAISQLLVFVLLVQLPCYFTGKMWYVDVGWPTGLTLIALNCLSLGDGMPVRRYLVCGCMLLHGGRMMIGAVMLFGARSKWTFWMAKDLSRYEYAKSVWVKKKGMPESLWWLKAQQETLQQGFMNTCYLCLPCALASFNPAPNMKLLEVLGLQLWFLSYIFENAADLQKNSFVREVKQLRSKQRGKAGAGAAVPEQYAPVLGKSPWVTKYWLWGVVRHPNYLGEWGCWCGWALIGASQVGDVTEDICCKIVFWTGLALLPIILYDCLVYWTGASPAEHFSVQHRPGYDDYQATVPCFFPSFVGDVLDVGQHRERGWPSFEKWT